MNVVFSSSNAYSKCTGVAIYSLLENNRNMSDLVIYLVTTDMSEENKNMMVNLCSMYGRNIYIIDALQILKDSQKKLGLTDFKGGLNTYVRAVANKILPEYVESALFVDSDIIFTDSLQDLNKINMEKYIVAGVPEIMLMTDKVCYEDVDLLNKCPNYLNYGVVLFNLKKWRLENGDTLIFNCVRENPLGFKIAEQSILNLSFKDYTTTIPLRYNFYTILHETSFEQIEKWYPKRKLFTKKDLLDAQTKPAIIHFVGDYFNRPWYKNNICRYKDVYYSYYLKSPWGNDELDDIPNGYSFIFKLYYSLLIFLRKNHYDNAYFKFRYIFIQWLREKRPSIDNIKRKKTK